MPNNVAISITADVAGATANLALARAEATEEKIGLMMAGVKGEGRA